MSSFLFTNNIRLHYEHWNRGSARPVILLHGLASNLRIWELTVPYLTAAGLEPIAWDGRGHGLSDGPDGDYGFDTYLADLGGFIEACQVEHPLIVGHSWGGWLALAYAARVSFGPHAPSGIVLVDGGFVQLDQTGLPWEDLRDRLTPPRLAGTPLDDLLARLRAPNPGWQLDETAIQTILANFSIDEHEHIYPHLSFEHHMQIVRAMWEFKTYDYYTRLRCPVLAIAARPADITDPDEAGYLALKENGLSIAAPMIADLQVQWMPDTIHDIPLQRPIELAELIIRFANELL